MCLATTAAAAAAAAATAATAVHLHTFTHHTYNNNIVASASGGATYDDVQFPLPCDRRASPSPAALLNFQSAFPPVCENFLHFGKSGENENSESSEPLGFTVRNRGSFVFSFLKNRTQKPAIRKKTSSEPRKKNLVFLMHFIDNYGSPNSNGVELRAVRDAERVEEKTDFECLISQRFMNY